VAFNATDSTGVSRVWVRPLAALEANPLPGTEGAGRPFWSPDSRQLGFFASGKLKKVQVTGGPPVVICDAPTGSDATWGKTNVILYDGRERDPLYRVSAGGGVPAAVVAADSAAGERFVGWPEFLPDGRRFVYMAGGTKSVIKLGKLESKTGRELFPCDSRVQYAPPGFLIFSRSGTLVAQPFNASSGKAKGDPIPIAEEVVTNGVGGADFSVSSTGVLAYSNRRGQLGQLVKLDRTGRVTATLSSAGDILHPTLSPDLRKVALRIRDSQSQTRDIWVVDLARTVSSRLTFEPRNENYPVWSPDGARLIYYSDSPDASGLYVRHSTGAGRSEQVLASSQEAVALDWSRDGRFVLYSLASPRSGNDIWVLSMSGEVKPRPLLDGPFDEFQARFSPDGRWIAYMSNESGREEVYVQSFPEPGGKWQVSTRGGSDPVWRPDGRELFYLSADQQMMSMPVAASPTFEVAVPQALFAIRVLVPSGARNHYAVTPDGQTFYAVSPLEGESIGATTVVVNWSADLKKQ
jgi:Tol biopolymer transport system component